MKRKKDLERELESQYGKIILFSFAQYWGGHKREIAGGKINDFSLGMMYLFENHFLFRTDVAKQENYREILIPIKSIITEDWNTDNSNDESLVEGIKVFEDNNGLVKKKFVVPFIDKDGVKQKPVFSIMGNFGTKNAVGVASWWGGGGITKWMQVFYDVILKSKEKLAESIEVNHDIENWIKEWEGPTLEFKRADILDDSFKLARSMVALGNNKSENGDIGGRIVIGINNETHAIEGVNSKSKHEEHIMNIGRDRCKPPIIPIFKKINHKGKTLYVISIPKMKNVPYQLKTKDGYVHLIRAGSTIRDPHPEEIFELYNKSKSEEENKN